MAMSKANKDLILDLSHYYWLMSFQFVTLYSMATQMAEENNRATLLDQSW